MCVDETDLHTGLRKKFSCNGDWERQKTSYHEKLF